MDYSRSKTRSYFGAISDRYADGLDTVLVIGDVTHDIDEFYVQTKARDGYPVVRFDRKEERMGCAEAVCAMLEGLGQRARAAEVLCSTFSIKRRIIVDNRVVCRIDEDKIAEPPADLPPAALVLLADYHRGVLDEATMGRIAHKYHGKEIIADWHPSRPLEFYRCATALKASWDAPHDDRPFVRTMGAKGMLLRAEGKEQHFPAKALQAIDPCGAGDMVLAALGAGRMLGYSWEDCCEWASEAAAKVCQRWGSVAVHSRWTAWKGEANELPA